MVCRVREMFVEKLRIILQDGIREGSLYVNNESHALHTIEAMTAFLNLDWMKEHPESFRDHIVENMLDILLNGIKRRSE